MILTTISRLPMTTNVSSFEIRHHQRVGDLRRGSLKTGNNSARLYRVPGAPGDRFRSRAFAWKAVYTAKVPARFGEGVGASCAEVFHAYPSKPRPREPGRPAVHAAKSQNGEVKRAKVGLPLWPLSQHHKFSPEAWESAALAPSLRTRPRLWSQIQFSIGHPLREHNRKRKFWSGCDHFIPLSCWLIGEGCLT